MSSILILKLSSMLLFVWIIRSFYWFFALMMTHFVWLYSVSNWTVLGLGCIVNYRKVNGHLGYASLFLVLNGLSFFQKPKVLENGRASVVNNNSKIIEYVVICLDN